MSTAINPPKAHCTLLSSLHTPENAIGTRESPLVVGVGNAVNPPPRALYMMPPIPVACASGIVLVPTTASPPSFARLTTVPFIVAAWPGINVMLPTTSSAGEVGTVSPRLDEAICTGFSSDLMVEAGGTRMPDMMVGCAGRGALPLTSKPVAVGMVVSPPMVKIV